MPERCSDKVTFAYSQVRVAGCVSLLPSKELVQTFQFIANARGRDGRILGIFCDAGERGANRWILFGVALDLAACGDGGENATGQGRIRKAFHRRRGRLRSKMRKIQTVLG